MHAVDGGRGGRGRFIAVGAAWVSIGLLAAPGCQGPGTIGGSKAAGADTGTVGVGGTAGAGGAGAVVSAPVAAKRAIDLEYFEQLERKAAVSQDDLLTGLMIVATSSIGRDYSARVAEAKRLGWIEAGFDRPARRGLLAQELAPVAARAAKLPGIGPATGEASDWRAAQAELERRGWLPTGISPEAVVTGPQLLAVLMRVSDALGLGRGGRPAEPDAFADLGFGPAGPGAEPAKVDGGGVARVRGETSVPAAVDANAPRLRARPEPLPALRRAGQA